MSRHQPDFEYRSDDRWRILAGVASVLMALGGFAWAGNFLGFRQWLG